MRCYLLPFSTQTSSKKLLLDVPLSLCCLRAQLVQLGVTQPALRYEKVVEEIPFCAAFCWLNFSTSSSSQATLSLCSNKYSPPSLPSWGFFLALLHIKALLCSSPRLTTFYFWTLPKHSLQSILNSFGMKQVIQILSYCAVEERTVELTHHVDTHKDVTANGPSSCFVHTPC